MSQVLVLQVILAKASSARIVSRPASGGTYRAGETVAVELGFGEDILVRGTPQLELELDSGKVVARYASGSGTGTLRFEYVVRIGDHTARIEASLDEDDETALRLGGATITDARGEAVDPGTPALANNAPNQKVEARSPPVTGVSMASSPASGDTYGVGETVTVRLTMREDVTVVLRDALVAAVQANDAAVTDCSLVTAAHLAGITGVLRLSTLGIEALKPGDFAGLSGLTALYLNGNPLTALPAGIFDGLGAVTDLGLRNNLPAGSLPDRVFEKLTRLNTLDLRFNPGFASFLPLADAGADLVLDAGETATLGGPGVGPWGTNADHRWVEVDADGNEVMSAERTEGLAAADVARPGFTAPALAEERVLRYRFTVQGRGWAYNRPAVGYRASDTVAVTVASASAAYRVRCRGTRARARLLARPSHSAKAWAAR